MSVYGDMLQCFGELYTNAEYFHFTPQPVSGFSKREVIGTVKGILQYMKKSQLNTENYTLTDAETPVFWTRSKLMIGDYFIEYDDEIFRITGKQNWVREGSFYCYTLETYAGVTDKQTAFDYVNLGTGDFD